MSKNQQNKMTATAAVAAPPPATTKNGDQSKTRENSSLSSQKRKDSSSSLSSSSSSSMTMAFLIYCVVPLYLVLMLSLYGEYNALPSSSKDSLLKFMMNKFVGSGGEEKKVDDNDGSSSPLPTALPTASPKMMNDKMGQQQQQKKLPKEVEDLLERNRLKQRQQQQQQQQQQQVKPTPITSRSDPLKQQYDMQISRLRASFHQSQDDEFKALALADALRARDLAIHDGGSAQDECIEIYHKALDIINLKKAKMMQNGEVTNVAVSAAKPNAYGNLNDEMFLDYVSKSVDGLLCAVYTALGKIYFMANMFEKAVKSYDQTLSIEPSYLDALTYRASSLIILGRYEEAAMNYTKVIQDDGRSRTFVDAFLGMSKILTAKEEAVPNGWDSIVPVLENEIPKVEMKKRMLESHPQQERAKEMVSAMLKTMHLAMFAYHDVKTKDTSLAWHHLSTAYEHKMSALPPWDGSGEAQRIDAVTRIFKQGFWTEGTGSPSRVPIFIIGFVRSGSTLLERVLDAHPLIVGTGEDSVFNGRLEYIRNKIVEASMTDPAMVPKVVKELAAEVVKGMKDRWKALDAASSSNIKEGKEEKAKPVPRRFADKMLTNYLNVGFIHMLFPRALILHVAREPMDTVFSAFKHDFPPGTLDYTSEFPSLAQLYQGYRKIMKHWDEVLPGRVTHVRYEDMVRDMPNIARSIINATGLRWDEDVLQFHKKKQAVNTLSTTQVRKGVYSHHLKSWMKYEEELEPLVELLGDDVEWDLKTSLPNYVAPPLEEEENKVELEAEVEKKGNKVELEAKIE